MTINVVGDDKKERRELIDDMTELLDNIMKVFMPEAKKTTLMVPCPLCPFLHITLSEVSILVIPSSVLGLMMLPYLLITMMI